MGEISQPFIGLLAALAAGLLVGLERGWTQRDVAVGRRVAGFRTFGLIGLGGGLAGVLPDAVAAALCIGIGAILAIGYAREQGGSSLSSTTVIAGLLTFAAGFVCVRVSAVAGLATASAMFVILSARHSMHALLKGLSEIEIEGVARFVLVALVILPLLPDRDLGPYDAWNPRQIWMVVVFVTGLSFAGYLAARRLGAGRGTLILATTGAVVSSTAVTVGLARRLGPEAEARGFLSAGIAIASIVMFMRVQLVVLILAPRALPSLALILAPATIVAAIMAFIAARGQHAGRGEVSVGNPFGFAPALLLAGAIALLSLVARWILTTYGAREMAVVLGLTGMSDVDAAVVTLSRLPPDVLGDDIAGLVLSATVLANTALKAVLTMVIGWGQGGVKASLPLISALIASALSLAAWLWIT